MGSPSQELARITALLNTPGLPVLLIHVNITGEIQLTALGPDAGDVVRVTFSGLSTTNLFESAPQDWWKHSTTLTDAVKKGWISVPADQSAPAPPPTPPQPVAITGGEYMAVTSIGQRDALVSPPVGFRVRVTSTPYVFEWNGEFWFIAERVGNQALLDFLLNNTSVYNMYVSGSGSDDNLGTIESPWRSIQRAFDEIPNHVNGTAFVNLLGAGPFDEALARDYESPNYLHLMVIGDRTNPGPSGTLTIPGVAPSNPTGGVKHAVTDYNIGAYGGNPFSNASHWVDITNPAFASSGLPASYPLVMDGAHSTTPNVRLVQSLDIAGDYGTVFGPGTVFTTHPFVSIVENQRLDSDFGNFEHFTWLKAPYSHSQKVYYAGVIIAPNTGVTVTNCAIRGCQALLSYIDDSVTVDANVHVIGDIFPVEVVIAGQGRDEYLFTSSGGQLSGIFDGGVIDFFSPSGFISNTIFRNIGSSGFQLVLGAHTNPAPGTAVKLDGCDFEPPSGQNCVQLRRGRMRHGSFAGSSLNSHVGSFLSMDQSSWAEIEVPVHGPTTGVCVTVGSFSHCTGLSAFTTGAPLMRNTGAAGHDVQVGANAAAVSFATLPKTDIAQGDASLFARAE